MNTIGLFGTCGGSKWRDLFIAEYERRHIDYFNPQIDNWEEECERCKENGLPQPNETEAMHLANDKIILFPVTKETYGIGSLAEIGFSILQSVKNSNRYFIIMVEQVLMAGLHTNEVAAKESLRARKLVISHLKKLDLHNVYIVDTFNAMLDVSIVLSNTIEQFGLIADYSSSNIE